MREKVLLISILTLIIFISGCTQQTKTIKEMNVCGDGICGATEDCNICVEDCSCPPGKYCDEIGICREETCGDEICSSEENITQICCEDCGCLADRICNKITQTCQERTTISEADVKNIANNYLIQNKINGTILSIEDVYYKEEIVKQINIDCRTEDVPYPCQIILYVNSAGEIVEEMRTA